MSARENRPSHPPHSLLFPSDSPLPEGRTFTLAGRVTNCDEGIIVVVDAFAGARIAGQAEVEVNDLVVLEVRRDEGGLELVRVVERHRRRTRAHSAAGSQAGAPSVSGNVFRGAEAERFVHDGIALNLRDRARALSIVRSFFVKRGFLEVETPALVPSPGMDLHLDAVQATGGYLITSPEYQMKRLIVAGVPRQFQMARVFRHGELGARHNPEFTMLEWYRAFADVEQVMRDTEELVTELVSAFSGDGRLPGEDTVITVSPPFPRLTVAEAFARFAGVTEAEFFRLSREDESAFFRLLVERVEPELEGATTPVFLVDYPIEQASLARAKPSDPRVAERFELYLGGLELCNGFGELTDPEEQRQRFLRDQAARTQAGKPVYPIDERFLAALAEGMPPSAGNALGIDRLLALCLGEHEIARVMAFPSSAL